MGKLATVSFFLEKLRSTRRHETEQIPPQCRLLFAQTYVRVFYEEPAKFELPTCQSLISTHIDREINS